MKFEVIFTRQAEADLKKISRKIAGKILKKLFWYSQQENCLRFAKRLVDREFGEYRFRMGDYRVIFDLNRKSRTITILIVLAIKHRKNAYK